MRFTPGGRGECRVRAAPAVPCALLAQQKLHTSIQVKRRTLRHPLRNGFTAYNVISLVSGLVVTIARGTLPAGLTPASRRQDHTTSPYADDVSSGVMKRLTPSASTASHPDVQ
jgi:hypothetical protein